MDTRTGLSVTTPELLSSCRRDSGGTAAGQVQAHLEVQVLQVLLQLLVGVVGLQGDRKKLSRHQLTRQEADGPIKRRDGDTPAGAEA